MIQFLKASLIFLMVMSSYSYELNFKKNKSEKVSINFSEINGSKVYSQTDEEKIAPASVLKIFSMTYALNVLGPNFKFKTKIFHTGKIENNILNGDLYFVGDGDPYFNHPQLVNTALSVVRREIKKVNGNLYYDNTLFPQIDVLSKLGLGDQTYNPSVGALNAEFNRLSLWTSTRPPKSIIPGMPLEIKEAKSGFMPTQDFRSNDDAKESWWMRKNAKLTLRTDLPIRDAGQWSAQLLKYHLNNFGVEVTKVAMKKLPKDSTLISSEASLPLWNLVTLTMEYSNNLLAEAIALRACVEKRISPLTLENCAKVISKSINSKSPPKIFNSSGLSVDNELSAKDMTNFLKSNFQKSWKNHTFLSLLSYSGQSGWLRNRLASPGYNMRVFAKTGSLDFVNNIAGYIRTRSEKWYSFSLLHTEDKKREAISELDSKNYKTLKNQAETWRKKSLDRTDSFLKEFIDNN